MRAIDATDRMHRRAMPRARLDARRHRRVARTLEMGRAHVLTPTYSRVGHIGGEVERFNIFGRTVRMTSMDEAIIARVGAVRI